jgi:hypothetical protein
VFFSDEAWFHLSGYVNSQNSRFGSSEVAIQNISDETLKKHGDTCEYMLRRKWRSFSTFAVKSCKLFSKYVFVCNKLL